MNTKIHGVISLGIVGVATLLATIPLWQRSWKLGLAYLALCGAAAIAALYAYCAKCPARTNCAHIFPGKIAVMLTNRTTAPYTMLEFAVLGGLIVILWGLPLLWLWKHLVLLAIFVILNAIATIQILTAVCRNCENTFCPGNRRYHAS